MLDLVDAPFAGGADSGGLQKKRPHWAFPANGARNTERPITIAEGTNRLVPDPRDLATHLRALKRVPLGRVPEGWDGRAGEPIVCV